jgi:hypothetical protein
MMAISKNGIITAINAFRVPPLLPSPMSELYLDTVTGGRSLAMGVGTITSWFIARRLSVA